MGLSQRHLCAVPSNDCDRPRDVTGRVLRISDICSTLRWPAIVTHRALLCGLYSGFVPRCPCRHGLSQWIPDPDAQHDLWPQRFKGDCPMSRILTRRRFIKGLAGLSVAVPAGIATASLANRYGLIPPDYGGLFGVETSLTYASQRLLTYGQPLA